jgi:hypothetical protein
VSGNELYALVQTGSFNELLGYDLDQINHPDFFGFDADFLAPLNITNLLPQNSITRLRSLATMGAGESAAAEKGGAARPRLPSPRPTR